MNSIVKEVWEVSDRVNHLRNNFKVLAYLNSEVGELSDEILLKEEGMIPGEDGILGESVDIILVALDLIRLNYPKLKESDLMKVVVKKCNKWERKYSKPVDF